MPRKENLELIETCKRLILTNGSYEQVCAVRNYGLHVVDQDVAMPDYVQTAFYMAMADLLAEVYESTLKWMDHSERQLIEDQIAFAVWMQAWHDMRAQVKR